MARIKKIPTWVERFIRSTSFITHPTEPSPPHTSIRKWSKFWNNFNLTIKKLHGSLNFCSNNFYIKNRLAGNWYNLPWLEAGARRSIAHAHVQENYTVTPTRAWTSSFSIWSPMPQPHGCLSHILDFSHTHLKLCFIERITYPLEGPPRARSNTWSGFNNCLNLLINFTP